LRQRELVLDDFVLFERERERERGRESRGGAASCACCSALLPLLGFRGLIEGRCYFKNPLFEVP
jgi:hypothetical protein